MLYEKSWKNPMLILTGYPMNPDLVVYPTSDF